MNENAEKTRAQICGMTHEEWKAARKRSSGSRSRGRCKSKRPVSSLWDEVEGQGALFDVPDENGSRNGGEVA